MPARSSYEVGRRSLLFLLGGLCVMFFGIALLLQPGRDPAGPAIVLFLGAFWVIYAFIINKKPVLPPENGSGHARAGLDVPMNRTRDEVVMSTRPRKIRAPKHGTVRSKGTGLGEALREYDDTASDAQTGKKAAVGTRRSSDEEPFVAEVDGPVTCPTCGAEVPFEAEKCPTCGWKMDMGEF